MQDNETMAVEAVGAEEPAEAAETGSGEADALAEVRREMAELRGLVERMTPRESAEPTLTDEFRALYPDVSEGEIPDAVWEEVRRGLPPEAAYALWERREQVRREAAESVNRRNAGGAWGRADAAAADHLSPDEVRGMTPREVRENYARILESMKHWN